MKYGSLFIGGIKKYGRAIWGYLFFLILSLILGMALFLALRGVMAEQLESDGYKTAEVFRARAESMLREVNGIASSLQQDESLLTCLAEGDTPGLRRLDACRMLRKYGDLSSYINEIFIISPTQQYIYTNCGGYAYASLSAILSRVGETEESMVFPAEEASWRTVHLNRTAPFFYRKMIFGDDQREATLIVTLRMTEFLRMMHHTDAEMCAIYNEQCVISTLPSDNADLSSSDSVSAVLGVPVHLVRVQTDDFTYLAAIATEHYDRPQNYIVLGFSVYFAIMILFGLACALWAGRQQYRDISLLAASVSSVKVNHNATYTELRSYIRSSLADYDEKLKMSLVREKEEKLISLLSARVEGAPAALLADCGLPDSDATYYVINFFVSDLSADAISRDKEKNQYSLISAAFRQTLGITAASHPGAWAGARTTGGYVAVIAPEGMCGVEEIEAIALRTVQLQEEKYGISCRAMVSRGVDSANLLCKAFRETEQMYQYVQGVGAEAKMLSYHFLDQQTVLNWDYLRRLNVMINLLLAGRFGEVPQQLETILTEHVSDTIALSLVGSRIRTLSHILVEAVMTTRMQDFNYVNGPQRLTLASTPEELMKAASEIFSTLAAMEQSGQNDDVVSRTCDYIRSHLGDVNLNVTVLCDSAGVSAQHLSRMFKKQTNRTLMEYVNALRIDRARELLRETDLTVSAIANETGYGNVKTFLRNFQTLTGMTPSNYRKAAQESASDTAGQ